MDEFPDSIVHKYKYNVFDDCVNDVEEKRLRHSKKYFTNGRKKEQQFVI